MTGVWSSVLLPLLRLVTPDGAQRTPPQDRARRLLSAGRNLRVGPREARRQLAAQYERRWLVAGASAHGSQTPTPRRPVDATEHHPMTDELVETLSSLGEALEAAEIPYVVVPPLGQDPYVVAVPRRYRRRALRAVRELPDGGRAALEAEAPSGGYRLEFWSLDRTLRDRLWRWRWELAEPPTPPGPMAIEQVRFGDRRFPTVGSIPASPRVDEITFPIDIVYTWVDGTDPEWRARKDRTLRELDPGFVDAADPSRFHDRDELRYSLRSVAMYADFVRHIYIVTDAQVPRWLDTDHERISIVDHRELFEAAEHLPTFNSHAIESRLHHIQGLAEHYLYFNDDFFLGRRVPADRFFHANGTSKFFLSHARVPSGSPSSEERSVDAAAVNTRRLVEQRFGRRVHHKLKHTPYPQRRSVLFEMEAALREEFERTAASRIRSPTDVPVPSSLFHYYAYLTDRAVPARIASQYVSLGEQDLSKRLRGLRARRNFDVLCINDAVEAHTDDPDQRSRNLSRFMASYWPTRSPFER